MTLVGTLSPDASGERRTGAARRRLRLDLDGAVGADGSANVEVLNLTAQGALLRTEQVLHSGERVRLVVPEGGAAVAKIVWANEHLYGCRFERPLSPAAVAAILLKSAPDHDPVEDLAPDPSQTEAPRPADSEPASFGARLQRLRKDRGLSLAELAQQVGVSKPALWKWEQGVIRPRPQALDRLAEILGLSPSELLFGHAENAQPGPSLQPVLAAARSAVAEALGLPVEAVEITVTLRS